MNAPVVPTCRSCGERHWGLCVDRRHALPSAAIAAPPHVIEIECPQCRRRKELGALRVRQHRARQHGR
jgi:hypothetical protein